MVNDDWQQEWFSRGVFVHRTAIVDSGAKIGAGTKVWHFTHIRNTAVIGENCVIGQGCYVDDLVSIGDCVKIANGVQVYSGVVIHSAVFIGPNTTFTNDLFPRATDDEGEPVKFTDPETTVVCCGASIGAGCVILPVVIGEDAMIAAGSVITKNVAGGCLVKNRITTEIRPMKRINAIRR